MIGLFAGIVGPEIRKRRVATVHHSTDVLLKFLGKQAEQKKLGKFLSTFKHFPEKENWMQITSITIWPNKWENRHGRLSYEKDLTLRTSASQTG